MKWAAVHLRRSGKLRCSKAVSAMSISNTAPAGRKRRFHTQEVGWCNGFVTQVLSPERGLGRGTGPKAVSVVETGLNTGL